MEPRPNAPKTTHSSPVTDGEQLAPWRSVRSLLASKVCVRCGKQFSPRRSVSPSGRVNVLDESVWETQVSCSKSCAKKIKNPMSNHQSRLKMRATLKRIRHQPIRRGGNGRLLPLPQLALLHALGEGWEAEYVVKTGKLPGYPHFYSLDLAHAEWKICLELDGGSHGSLEKQELDRKKVAFLASIDWSVFRVSNERALYLYSTFESVGTLLTSLMDG